MRRFRVTREFIGVGVGLAIVFVVFGAEGGFRPDMPDRTRYIYIAVMVILAIVALLAAARRTQSERAAIITARAKERRKYLPKLQQGVADYVNQMEYLAQDKRLYKLNQYSIGFKKPSLKWTLMWFDNHVYSRIQRNDEQLPKVIQILDSYNTYVRDRKLRRLVLGLLRVCHRAYSYVIYTKLVTAQWQKVPFVVRAHYKLGRRAQEKLRRLQYEINERIRELLEGEPDEL